MGVKKGVNSLCSWKLTRFARGRQKLAVGETIVLHEVHNSLGQRPITPILTPENIKCLYFKPPH